MCTFIFSFLLRSNFHFIRTPLNMNNLLLPTFHKWKKIQRIFKLLVVDRNRDFFSNRFYIFTKAVRIRLAVITNRILTSVLFILGYILILLIF